MKRLKFAWLAGLVLVAGLCGGCAMFSEEAVEAGAAQARKLAGTAAIEERLAAVEERQKLAYAFTWLTAEKNGISETAARDWLAGKSAPAEEEADAPAADVDAIEFTKLQWKFGGVDGARAALSTPRLSGLKAGAKSLSYKWDSATGAFPMTTPGRWRAFSWRRRTEASSAESSTGFRLRARREGWRTCFRAMAAGR